VFAVLFCLSGVKGWGQTTFFSENMGSPSGTTSIASNTFQNGSPILFSGTGDVRITSASSGYTGASGNGNIFITNSSGTNFIIGGINTSSYSSISLSFGMFKSGTGSLTSTAFVVEFSTDGGSTYPTSATFTNSAGATWTLINATGTIPSSTNLYIRFRQNQTTQSVRIDDVKLTGTASGSNSPTLSAEGGATVDAPFDVTFTEDATWRSAITGITVGGTTLSASAYSTTTAGKV